MPKKSRHDYIDECYDTLNYSSQIMLNRAVIFQINIEKERAEKANEGRETSTKNKIEDAKNSSTELLGMLDEMNKLVDAVDESEAQSEAILPPTLQLFDSEKVKNQKNSDVSSSSDRDEQRAKEARLKALERIGSSRILGTVGDDCMMRLDSLEADFPNFSEVIKYLRGVAAIALADDRTPQPAHILLNGAPGIGKTLFASCLANIFGTQMKIAHLETMQTSSDLVGSSVVYSNSTPGLIFNTLVNGDFANPLILLDELDKCLGDDRFPTEKALYNLLEETSKKFNDEAVPWLDIDASRIIYIATSNDASLIDPPILSRMMKFDIKTPSREQTRDIIENIFLDVVRSRPKAFGDLILSESAIKRLLDVSPRKIKSALKTAAGNALINGSNRIHDIDIELEPAPKSTKIGF